MKLISTIVLIFLFVSANAQTYVKPRIISYEPNSCNNVIVCEFFNVEDPNYVGYQHELYGFLTEANHQDTIIDACYYLDEDIFGENFLMYYYSNGYVQSSAARSTLLSPRYNYNVVNYTEPSSDTTADGMITIVFDSIISNNMYAIVINNIFGGENFSADTVYIDDFTFQINNLERGAVQVLLGDSINGTECHFFITIGDEDYLYAEQGMEVSINYQHANSSCDGWINIIPTEDIINSEIRWGSGINHNEFELNNLCPGLHSFYVFGLLNGEYVGHIDTLIITDDNGTFIDSNLYLYDPVDTAFYYFHNCDFNYSLPIDSIYYTQDTIGFIGDSAIALFEMTIFQEGSIIVLTDTLYFMIDSLTLLDIIIYCEEGTKSMFRSQRIKYLQSTSVSHNIFLTIPEVEKSTLLIYPNPSDSELTIELPSNEFELIEIRDVNGRIVLEDSFEHGTKVTQIQVGNLNSGVYFISIYTLNDVVRASFIKN